MRDSPAGARFVPLISTQVLGAICGVSPSAFATSVTAGAGTAAADTKAVYACATFAPVTVN